MNKLLDWLFDFDNWDRLVGCCLIFALLLAGGLGVLIAWLILR